MTVKKQKLFKNSLNLYKFIKLMLGQKISDRQIARKWKMDEKNFHEFKEGKYPVPRLPKLSELAKALNVDRHVVCQVAEGTPAQKVYDLIKTDNQIGLIKLLSSQLYKAHLDLTRQARQCHNLFKNANDAILIADVKTGEIINCNKEAQALLGRPRKEIIGMHQSQLHPFQKKDYYMEHFKGHVKKGRVVEMKKEQVIRKDGTIVPVFISARVMNIDNRKVIQGIFRNISGQKRKK